MPLANARVAHLLSMHTTMATVLEDQTSESANPNEYEEVVFMRNAETLEAFFLSGYICKNRKSSHRVIHQYHDPSTAD